MSVQQAKFSFISFAKELFIFDGLIKTPPYGNRGVIINLVVSAKTEQQKTAEKNISGCQQAKVRQLRNPSEFGNNRMLSQKRAINDNLVLPVTEY